VSLKRGMPTVDEAMATLEQQLRTAAARGVAQRRLCEW
jgi:hypothetical protein